MQYQKKKGENKTITKQNIRPECGHIIILDLEQIKL